jgi:hypothetical protein
VEAEEARLTGPLTEAWDAAADPEVRGRVLAAMKEALGTRAYLRTVVDDLEAVLGEGEESVTHHRH